MFPDLPDALDRKQGYLIGVSGGRDSAALTHWLAGQDFHKLIVCHLHHGLRPEANEDSEFVRNFATTLELPCELGRCAVSTMAEEEKISVETAARKARHHFFQKCAEKYETSHIFLAHHADDQAETILFNLLRGSAGLRGMQVTKQVGPLTFHRPLLSVRRADIDSYLKTHQLSWREDSTNAEPIATRNRLRHEVFPLLREILQRDPVPALLRATHHQDHLSVLLDELKLLDPQDRLYLPAVRNLPPSLQSEVLYQFLRRARVPNLSSALITAAREILAPDAVPSVNLPGDRRLRRKESRLFIDGPEVS